MHAGGLSKTITSMYCCQAVATDFTSVTPVSPYRGEEAIKLDLLLKNCLSGKRFLTYKNQKLTLTLIKKTVLQLQKKMSIEKRA